MLRLHVALTDLCGVLSLTPIVAACGLVFPGCNVASETPCAHRLQAKTLVAWRDANEPTMEVWLSEFGYDTNEHSPNLAPAYGVFDAEDVQGMWIVRSFLYLALARIDRAQMFMLANSADDSWNKFVTSGLTNCGGSPACRAGRPRGTRGRNGTCRSNEGRGVPRGE